MSSNILITGGTGFVGSWMKKTQPEGFAVCYASRKGYNNWLDWDWNYIVHLAPVSPARCIENIQRNKGRLLYCSSGIVYHMENDTMYRRNKIRWEQECLDSGADVVIARPFTFMRSSKAYNALFDAAREGKPLEVWGDCTRSFMHGAEMGRWMWAILLRGESGQAYDVGSDKPTTILRLARRIQAFTTWCDIKQVACRPVPMPVYLPENTDRTKSLL